MINNAYLIQYVSRHLHTFVRCYSLSFETMNSFCGRFEFQDTSLLSDVEDYFFKLTPSPEIPLLISVNATFIYCWIPAEKNYYLLGPVRLPQYIYLIHQLNGLNCQEDLLRTTPVCNFLDVVRDTLLIFNLNRNKILTENDLMKSCCIPEGIEQEPLKYYQKLLFENQEFGRVHNPYDQEIREQMSIEQGNLEHLKLSIEEDYIGELGILSKDPLRNVKNQAICVLAVACRSAIRGGISPEIAFSLSDSYILKIDESKNIPEVIHLIRSAEFQYAAMVHETKALQHTTLQKEENIHIRKCKDYIFSHLHDKLEVQDIAEELSVSSNYLSGLFRRYEGITLNQFIHQEKLKLVKNMLIYSQYSYIEIAAYLGYSSQSHLGKQFKKATGYTLHQYRELFGVNDFRS